jgi:hypothetical protein
MDHQSRRQFFFFKKKKKITWERAQHRSSDGECLALAQHDISVTIVAASAKGLEVRTICGLTRIVAELRCAAAG